ncbi:MAG: magnesium transporter [Thermoanaerobaculia bacterium]
MSVARVAEDRLAPVHAAIQAHQWENARDLIVRLHPADIADVIIDLPPDEEGILFRLLPRDLAAKAFAYLPLDQQEALIHSLTSDELKVVMNEMAPDDRMRLFGEVPAAVTRKILESLSPEELRESRLLLGYPEGTAGHYMTPHYVAIRPEMTAAEALESIRRAGKSVETLNVVYIVDDQGMLVEDVRIGSLVLAEPGTLVTDIQDPKLVALDASASVDEVLQTFEKYDRVALPVIDKNGQMLGIITADDVLDLAQHKATKEIQNLGGSEALDAPYLDVGFWAMVRKRGGWLSALFLGEMLTATAMSYFEVEIAKAVVLALFVPLIISSGGNSGSQATSLIIRSLALRELKLRDWFRVFRREILSGLALGSLLGFIGFLRILLWQRLHFTSYGTHYMLVASTVGASLIGVVMFGSTAGAMLPFILRKLGFDPATSSAPFVATLVDVSGLIIYFTIALVILRGTLL